MFREITDHITEQSKDAYLKPFYEAPAGHEPTTSHPEDVFSHGLSIQLLITLWIMKSTQTLYKESYPDDAMTWARMFTLRG